MSAADRVYRVLLLAYPASFRAAYGEEMALAFRDQCREAVVSPARLWGEMVWDVARSAPAQRADSLRARWMGQEDFPTQGGTMKVMAILTALIGALVLVSAGAEGWSGGMVRGDGHSLAAGTMGVVAGALLLASGIVMLRRAPYALSLARGAAVASMVLFSTMWVATPRIGILTTLLGVVFPLALLLFLQLTRGRGPRVA